MGPMCECEQRFYEGDTVMIRRFDEIDRSEIGSTGLSATNCFSIGKNYINNMAKRGPAFVISSVRKDYRTYIYTLCEADSGERTAYWWAQGMLSGAEEEEIEPPDTEGLIGFLFG